MEAAGLTRERVEELRRELGSTLRLPQGNGTYVAIRLPSVHHLQDFRFALYNGERRQRIYKRPGKDLVFPASLKVNWRQLPGVVRCWVKADDYQTGLSARNAPEIALRVFSGSRTLSTRLGEKSVPTDWYSGRTIGPVPVPTPELTRGEFLKRLENDLVEAREWGWLNADVAGSLADRLHNFAGDSGPDSVSEPLQEIESLRRDGALLEEASVLLKYNLEYLTTERWQRR